MPATMVCVPAALGSEPHEQDVVGAPLPRDASSVRINRKLRWPLAFRVSSENATSLVCSMRTSWTGLGPQQKSVGELVGRDPDAARDEPVEESGSSADALIRRSKVAPSRLRRRLSARRR